MLHKTKSFLNRQIFFLRKLKITNYIKLNHEIYFGKKHSYTPQIVSSEVGTYICHTIDSFLISSKYFETEISKTLHGITSSLGENTIFVNIGSHLGRYAIEYADFFKQVYCFEPTPDTFSLLKANIILSQKNNIIAYNRGVSREKGTLSFEINSNYESQNMVISQKTDNSIDIEVNSFDNSNIEKENIRLMLIDVEGHEIEVIEGMRDFLSNSKELFLIIEVLHSQKLEAVKKLLIEFNCEKIDPTNYLFSKKQNA